MSSDQIVQLILGLPLWAILIIVIVYLILKFVVPRINKAPASVQPVRGASVPQMQAINPHTLHSGNGNGNNQHVQVQQLAQQFGAQLSNIMIEIQSAQDRHHDRLQKVLEQHFELDRQQVVIMEKVAMGLEGVARRLESGSRQEQVMLETAEAARLAAHRSAKTSEAILDRLENTGRFNVSKP